MSNEWEMSGIGRSLGELGLTLSGLHRDYDKPLRHIPTHSEHLFGVTDPKAMNYTYPTRVQKEGEFQMTH